MTFISHSFHLPINLIKPSLFDLKSCFNFSKLSLFLSGNNSSFQDVNIENEDDETNNRHYYPLPENSSYSLTNDTEGNYYIIVTRNIDHFIEIGTKILIKKPEWI